MSNGWLDVWNALVANEVVYIVHDLDALTVAGTVYNPALDGAGVDLNRKIESVQFANVSSGISPDNTAKMTRAPGEVYDVTVGLLITQVDDFEVYPQ